MTIAEIIKEVNKVKKMHSENDPEKICAAMGIDILYMSMGHHHSAIKGFVLETKNEPIIFVNQDLPDVIQRIIIGHELAHVICHVGEDKAFDRLLYNSSNKMEIEANMFLAELLLDDQDVLEELNSGKTFFGAAKALYVPPELLDYKFRIMKSKGYKLVEPPTSTRSNFLKDIDRPDYYLM